MAFETIVTGKIINLRNTAVPSATVKLLRVLEQNPITGYRNTSLISTGTTDQGGFVQFSGVAVGNYDVVVTSGASYTLYNYEVKNEYVVVPGDSQIVEESRTFVRSLETFSGIGVSTEERPNNQLGYPDRDYSIYDTYKTLKLQTDLSVDRLDDAEISGTFLLQRETGDTYYRANQNIKLVQNFTFKISA